MLTCDQDHNYNDEQRAFDDGLMDKFPQTVGQGSGKSPEGNTCIAGDVMNYYDGNTTTALWNYAQQYAMSDNSYSTTFGPFLVVSPWAKHNAVDHTLTDQASIITFVEDNWTLPRIAGSADAVAGSLDGMFDFGAKKGNGNALGNAPNTALRLDPVTGQPTR